MLDLCNGNIKGGPSDMKEERSPLIKNISWGKVQVEGYRTPFKDVKLYPGGAREWDWSETGTHHSPGIQPADVQELIDRGASAVILTKGMQDQLEVRPETLQLLEKASVRVHIINTKDAADLFNQLRKNEAVAALIHSTC